MANKYDFVFIQIHCGLKESKDCHHLSLRQGEIHFLLPHRATKVLSSVKQGTFPSQGGRGLCDG